MEDYIAKKSNYFSLYEKMISLDEKHFLYLPATGCEKFIFRRNCNALQQLIHFTIDSKPIFLTQASMYYPGIYIFLAT